jgi:hypothetical protein
MVMSASSNHIDNGCSFHLAKPLQGILGRQTYKFLHIKALYCICNTENPLSSLFFT